MVLSIYDTFFDWGAYVGTVKLIQKGKKFRCTSSF